MDLDQVTLAQMRYATAVEEHRNFRVAAESCHVSQSGLSMQLQKMEDLLGVVLFDRGKKPVTPTEEGRVALEQMRVVLRETHRLGQVVSDVDELSGPFRLGVIPSLASTVLPLVLGPFLRRYPNVELLIDELKTEDIITQLSGDVIDAAIAATPLNVAGLAEQPLGAEAMLAYLSPGDPLLTRKQLRQKDLRERALWVMPEGHCFRSQVLDYCRSKNRPKTEQLQFESGSFETLIRLVDEGLGATVLPQLVVAQLPPRRQGAQVRPLVAPVPLRQIGLVYARRELRRGIRGVLAQLAQSILEQALGPRHRSGKVLMPLVWEE